MIVNKELIKFNAAALGWLPAIRLHLSWGVLGCRPSSNDSEYVAPEQHLHNTYASIVKASTKLHTANKIECWIHLQALPLTMLGMQRYLLSP